MYNQNIRFLSNLTFKTTTYRKNFDLIVADENIITEYEGNVSMLRIRDRKLPLLIGEYGFSVWNIKLARMLEYDILKLLKAYHDDGSYDELMKIVKMGLFDMSKYKKIVILHSLVIHPEFRKKNITEEYIETIYRDYYDDDVAILALVRPFQNNKNDREYYYSHKFISLKKVVDESDVVEKMSASDYYSLNNFEDNKDTEINEYKLFSVAARCGFNRIGDTYMFEFIPDKIKKRLLRKNNIIIEP